MKILYFLIGASGAGKTTAAKMLEKKEISNLSFFYFDSIGVPSQDEMVKKYGSGEEWQRAKTIEWTQKIKKERLSTKNAILDAQTRPAFIEDACKKNNISAYKIILFDCSNKIRKQRLINRGHTDLANKRMMNWAKYLREECISRKCVVIDTSNLTIDESVSSLLAILKKKYSTRHVTPNLSTCRH